MSCVHTEGDPIRSSPTDYNSGGSTYPGGVNVYFNAKKIDWDTDKVSDWCRYWVGPNTKANPNEAWGHNSHDGNGSAPECVVAYPATDELKKACCTLPASALPFNTCGADWCPSSQSCKDYLTPPATTPPSTPPPAATTPPSTDVTPPDDSSSEMTTKTKIIIAVSVFVGILLIFLLIWALKVVVKS